MLLSRCSGNLQTAKQTNKAHKEATEAGRHDADMETAYTPRHTHTYTKKERPAGRQEVGRWATCHAVVDVVHDTKTPVWDRDGSLCGPSDAARPSSSRREGKSDLLALAALLCLARGGLQVAFWRCAEGGQG